METCAPSLLDACCGSNEAAHRNSLARLFTDLANDDKRLSVRALPRLLASLFATSLTEDDAMALAKRVASHTVFEARQDLFDDHHLEQTLSFEEVEYIYEICRARGYILL